MNMKKRLGVLLLALVMLLSMAGCAGANETWALDVDGEQIPTGLYLYYQFNNYQLASTLAADKDVNLLKQQIEGQDASVWIYQKTAEACKTYVAINREFDKRGLTLTTEEQGYAEKTAEYLYETYKETFDKNGIGVESIKLAVVNDQKAASIFDNEYGAEGASAVSEADKKAYFNENYTNILSFGTFMPTESEEKSNKYKKAMDDAFALYQKDGDFFAAKDLFDEGIMEPLEEGETLLENDKSKQTEADYIVNINKVSGEYPESLIEKVFAMEYNVPFVYAEEGYLFLMERRDASTDTKAYEDAESTILTLMKKDEFNSYITDLASALTVTDNKACISYYSPKKIVNLGE